MDDLLDKLKKIKIVLTDVDGVLTDGGMYYTSEGDIMKKFHTRDGMGVTLLRTNSIKTIIVTKEKTPMAKRWATNMKIKKLYCGLIQKELILDKICKNFKVTAEEIAFIGDDINDLELLRKVGLSVTPNDGIEEVKKSCHYVCKAKGGEGAFREFADLILSAKK